MGQIKADAGDRNGSNEPLLGSESTPAHISRDTGLRIKNSLEMEKNEMAQ